MSISTWHNICNGMRPAVYKSYMAKSQRQRGKREVQEVMSDVDAFCDRKEKELRTGTYAVGAYRHFRLHDKKKERDMKIVHDWSGFYYDGTVYTDAEEEEMIRKQFNIPKSA